MKNTFAFYLWILALGLVMMVSISACGSESPTSTLSVTKAPPTITLQPATVTYTPVPPTPTLTPTPIPMAVLVNGEGITLAEYQAEIARYKQAQQEPGTNLATDEQDVQRQVMEDLIALCLLSQAARAEGFSADDVLVQSRIDQLAQELGGQQAVADWAAANGYTDGEFRLALKRSVEAAWMRDQIVQAVPDQTEQIHARQILLYNLEDANQVLAQLRSGQDFTKLAWVYNPTTGGDLGWFPRGILLDAGLEEIAFQLQPEQFSEVIETQAGYHILQVIERSTDRSIDPSTRLILQEKLLHKWLQDRRQQSDVQIVTLQ